MSQFTLNISNSNDLPDFIFQGSPNFSMQFILDERHNVGYIDIDPDKKDEIIEEQGIEYIERIDYMQQKELSFIIDADGARFLSRLKLYDTFTYTDYRGEAITPDEWDVKVETPDNELDTHYKKIIITIKINFFSKYANQINFTDVTAPDTKPTATGVNITGDNDVGDTITGNYTYVPNGGAEGTSEYRWFRADDSLGTNKQLISGETSTTYVLATADLNKFITFQVKPVSVAVILEGNWTESPTFQVGNNSAPTAVAVGTSPTLQYYNVEYTGTYTYGDINGDLQGTSIYAWYVADNSAGLNKTKVATTLKFTPGAANDGKYVRFEVIPVALTGVLVGAAKTMIYGQVSGLAP